ncbi:MAG: hypothetical protein HF312_15400 [Ignavibacteria bacterium]|jgi:hypothetical protein|nr:hypothetical protein [Ignavibacteria bacterium]
MVNGSAVRDPEVSIVLDALARRYPAYKAEDLLSEHAEIVEDWLLIAEEEYKKEESERKKAEHGR